MAGDGTVPTMTITATEVNDGDTSNDATLSLMFTSSEATTNFAASDISVSGGTISGFNEFSSTVYTATFTPTSDGACTIDVARGAFTDSVGNDNTAATQFNWIYDGTSPILTEITPVGHIVSTTPSYVFSSDEAGTITCSIPFTTIPNAIVGNNTITFDTLTLGLYDDVTINVTDAAGNVSDTLNISSFRVNIIEETTPVDTITNIVTPIYVFYSTKVGTIEWNGPAYSNITTAAVGENTIVFNNSHTLIDGEYSGITITLTDTEGVEYYPLTVSTFTIDTLRPILTEVVPVASITSETSPSYTFSSTEQGTITYTGSASSTTTIAYAGHNTITFDNLTNNTTYSDIIIKVTDAAGNESVPLPVSIFLVNTNYTGSGDTTAPTLTSVNTIGVTNNPRPSHTFYTNEAGTITCSVPFTSTSIAIFGNNTITFDTLDNGVHNVNIYVTDAMGNVSNPLEIEFTVDVMITNTVADTTGPTLTSVNTIGVTNNPTPSHTFYTNEAGTITCSVPFTSTSIAIFGNNTITFDTLADGSHNVNIYVTDASDNISSPLSISFTIDTALPDLQAVTLIENSSNNPSNHIRDVTPSYTFSSTKTGSIDCDYAFSSSGWVSVSNNLYENTITFNTLSDDTYDNIIISVTDTLGNKNTLLVNTFIIDTEVPVLMNISSINTPTNNQSPSYVYYSTKAGTLTLSQSVSWNEMFESTTNYEMIEAGNNTLTFNNLSEGVYNINMNIEDNFGNTGTLSIPQFEIDITNPTVVSSNIVSNNSTATLAKNGDVITLTFTTSKSVLTPTVSFLNSGNAVINPSSVTGTSPGTSYIATYTVHENDLNGNITININTTDIAGNILLGNTTIITGSITVDNTPPVLQELTPVSAFTNNSTPSYVFISSDTGTITSSVPFTSTATAVIGNNTIVFNTLNEGTYNITIQVTDDTGNVSSNLEVSEFTIDLTNPLINQSTMYSNNLIQTLAKVEDTVTFNIETNENIITPNISFTSGGNAITNSIIITGASPGKNFTASYIVNSNDTNGLVEASVIITDVAGNTTNTNISHDVLIDTISPSITSSNMVSNNSIANFAKAGHTITFTFETDEDIQTPVVYFQSGGQNVSNIANISSTSNRNYIVTYIVNELDINGEIIANISITDLVGNVTNTTINKNVIVDTIPPVITVISIASDNAMTQLAKAGDTVTVNIETNEDIITPNVSFTSGGSAVTNTVIISGSSPSSSFKLSYIVNSNDVNGLVGVNINATDIAGNKLLNFNTIGTGSVIINTVPPILNEVTPIITPTKNQTPSYIFSSNKSGTISSSIPLQNGSQAINGNNAIIFDTLVEGIYDNVTITVTDLAGNESNPLVISRFRIDLTSPVLTIDTNVSNPTNNVNPSIKLICDEIGTITSTLSFITTHQAISGLNEITFDTLSEGLYENVTITVTDGANNKKDIVLSSFTIDTTPPVLSIIQAVPSPLGINDTPSLVFNSSKAGTITSSLPFTSSNQAIHGNNTIVFNLNNTSKVYDDVFITVTDAAGNSSVSLLVNEFTAYLSNPVIYYNSEIDWECGKSYEDNYVNDSSPPNPVPSGTYFSAFDVFGNSINYNTNISKNNPMNVDNLGNYTINYTITDVAGNEVTVNRLVHVIDTIKPVITINGEENITHEAGTPYIDKGAISLDQYRSSVSVSIDNLVNINVLGTYTVTYTSVDDSSNEAIPVTRTVIVQDTLAPVITLTGNQFMFLRINSPYIELGASAYDAMDKDVTDNIVVEGSVDVSKPGYYKITYTVTDDNNHTAVKIRTVQVLIYPNTNISSGSLSRASISQNAILYSKNASPFKTKTVPQGSNFSLNRYQFRKNVSVASKGNDSSTRTQMLRIKAQKPSSIANNVAQSYKNVKTTYKDARFALARVRR